MKELLIEIIAYVIFALIGGHFVGDAVAQFKRNRYFLGGVSVMIAIANAGFIIKHVVL